MTERYWGALPEEIKTKWRIATFTISAIASLLIPKTGYRILDWAIVGYSALTTLLVLDSQRVLGKYKNKLFKKRIVSTTITLSLAGIYSMFAIVFATVCLDLANIFMNLETPVMAIVCNDCRSAKTTLFTISFLVISLVTSIVIRNIKPHSKLYNIPENTKNILIYRRIQVDGLFQLAVFELVIIATSYIFVWFISHFLNLIINTVLSV